MSWNDIRKQARATVHAQFALPAVYYSKDGLRRIPCSVRKHNNDERFGDLDREGFAQVVERANQLVFDSAEVMPQKGATVEFPDDGEVYTIDLILPKTSGQYIRCEVTLNKP